MHEYLLELYDNFEVKQKQSFAKPTQIFVFHWHPALQSEKAHRQTEKGPI